MLNFSILQDEKSRESVVDIYLFCCCYCFDFVVVLVCFFLFVCLVGWVFVCLFVLFSFIELGD